MAAQIINERIDPRMGERSRRNIGGNDAVTEKHNYFNLQERPAEKQAEKEKWYQDRPVAAELFWSSCAGLSFLWADHDEDPSYMDLKTVLSCRAGNSVWNRYDGKRYFLDDLVRRISLAIGLLSADFHCDAVLFGAVSGCAPAWLDALMRLTEIFVGAESSCHFLQLLRENPM